MLAEELVVLIRCNTVCMYRLLAKVPVLCMNFSWNTEIVCRQCALLFCCDVTWWTVYQFTGYRATKARDVAHFFANHFWLFTCHRAVANTAQKDYTTCIKQCLCAELQLNESLIWFSFCFDLLIKYLYYDMNKYCRCI